MKIVVQKYGGASLSTPEQVIKAAHRISRLRAKNVSVIAVVSAMGKTTDDLYRLAYQLHPLPPRRELDMLLSTGERISMSLLSMALQAIGTEAISFTGSQAGVLTDQAHGNARIVELKPVRVDEELRRGKVVVLAGFQGVDPLSKEITTLGRGGSDTTAVAMAAHYRAQRCEIIKEVKGVCSADPSIVPTARVLRRLSFSLLHEMCWAGAKVLHLRSAELALRLNVPLHIGFSDDETLQSVIDKEDPQLEKTGIIAVNSHAQVIKVTTREATTTLSNIQKKYRLALPHYLSMMVRPDGMYEVFLTGTAEQLKSLKEALREENAPFSVHDGLSSITCTAYGIAGSSLLDQLLEVLQIENAKPFALIPSPHSLSIIVEEAKREALILRLHELAELQVP